MGNLSVKTLSRNDLDQPAFTTTEAIQRECYARDRKIKGMGYGGSSRFDACGVTRTCDIHHRTDRERRQFSCHRQWFD